METPLSFAGNPLDRASAERPGEAWVAARRMVGRFLPFWQMKPLVRHGRAAFLPWDRAWEGCTTVFLGLDGGASAPAGATKSGASAPAGATKNDVPLFAVDLGATEPAPAVAGEFQDMRAAAMLLPGRDTAIAGQARALLDWHARHGFCPNCGHATESKDGGYRRLCPACGAEHFPRTDPVVIMLPTFGGECLVGRNARFVNGLFSAFAGFVEPGESLEEAVRRELREEVAVTVGAVRYHRSQPWPFPSSLMLGCYAEALSKDFAIDGSEIAEARWISKDQARHWLKDEVMDGMRIPATIAIAHHLVRDWVEG